MKDYFSGIKVLRLKWGGIEYLKEGDPVWGGLSVLVSRQDGGDTQKGVDGAYTY
jgi:hypothetical protein